MKSLYLDQFNATIRYHETTGEGPVIVYLAAVSYPSLPTFLPVATHPAMPRHRSIFVDYFGVGHSEHPADFDHSLQNHAKCVASILDHEGLKNCIVVGHSMGGTVAIYLALQRPDLVSNLIVCEGNLTTGGGVGTRLFTSVPEREFVETFFPEMLAKWRNEGREGDEYAFWRCGAWEGTDFAGVYRDCAALVNLDPDFKQKFFSLPIKRTFVYGEQDLPEITGEVKADAPDPDELKEHGISVAVVPDVGHAMMIVNPDGFAKVLIAAL
jgi:pimeloyl-ACP methyl ester carboxylesterase